VAEHSARAGAVRFLVDSEESARRALVETVLASQALRSTLIGALIIVS
jgi:hypothetical protein